MGLSDRLRAVQENTDSDDDSALAAASAILSPPPVPAPVGPEDDETTLPKLARAALPPTVPARIEREARLVGRDSGDDDAEYGPLQRLLDDPDVTEIMVNGPEFVYVERAGRLVRTGSRFPAEDELRRMIEHIASRVGRRIDQSAPLLEARLPDGSRVNAVLPPLASNGPLLTIQKSAPNPYQLADLIRLGTLSPKTAELLDACVKAGLTVLIAGGSDTGKTTLLNVLASLIPEAERIIIIEDATELQLPQQHVVRLESRPANLEGTGEVTIRDLVRTALRLRPDRIVVGELAGDDILDTIQAITTGPDGWLSTISANSPRHAVARLETLPVPAGRDAIREQIVSAIDVIVQLTRLRDGTRRVTAITAVDTTEQGITLQDVFRFHYSGMDAGGRVVGAAAPTGIRPGFADRFTQRGISVSPELFDPPPSRGR